MRRASLLAFAATILTLATPLAARDSLGVFGDWGAFSDPQVPRCYAIAAAEPSDARREEEPFTSVSTWPSRAVRGQVYFRLSRGAAGNAAITLTISGQRYDLVGRGSNAWARDRGMDAEIVAAMRSAGSMQVSSHDGGGSRFTDRYSLAGAATAIDAAIVGCARR